MLATCLSNYSCKINITCTFKCFFCSALVPRSTILPNTEFWARVLPTRSRHVSSHETVHAFASATLNRDVTSYHKHPRLRLERHPNQPSGERSFTLVYCGSDIARRSTAASKDASKILSDRCCRVTRLAGDGSLCYSTTEIILRMRRSQRPRKCRVYGWLEVKFQECRT